MNADILNKLFMIATKGEPFESANVDEEFRADFDEIVKELSEAPQGVMVSPINEWVGDEYDDVIAMCERVSAREEIVKSVGLFQMSKAVEEKKFTLGPMYIPNTMDAHNEWTDEEELQQAVWKYVKLNDRRIRLQHNRDVVAGEWVEIMTFPYETEVEMMKAGGGAEPRKFPKNTVFLGVIWEDWAWDKIKKGEIRGYSIGGKAERMYVDLEN